MWKKTLNEAKQKLLKKVTQMKYNETIEMLRSTPIHKPLYQIMDCTDQQGSNFWRKLIKISNLRNWAHTTQQIYKVWIAYWKNSSTLLVTFWFKQNSSFAVWRKTALAPIIKYIEEKMLHFRQTSYVIFERDISE